MSIGRRRPRHNKQGGRWRHADVTNSKADGLKNGHAHRGHVPDRLPIRETFRSGSEIREPEARGVVPQPSKERAPAESVGEQPHFEVSYDLVVHRSRGG